MDTKVIGDRIAKYRKLHNYTQEGLAEQLMITPQAVSRWENGHTLPETNLLVDLCGILQITIDRLLSNQEEIRTVEDKLPHELTNVQKLWDHYSENWYQRYRTKEVIDEIVNNPASASHICADVCDSKNGYKV